MKIMNKSLKPNSWVISTGKQPLTPLALSSSFALHQDVVSDSHNEWPGANKKRLKLSSKIKLYHLLLKKTKIPVK